MPLAPRRQIEMLRWVASPLALGLGIAAAPFAWPAFYAGMVLAVYCRELAERVTCPRCGRRVREKGDPFTTPAVCRGCGFDLAKTTVDAGPYR